MNHTDNLLQWLSFLCEEQRFPEWQSSEFTNSRFWNYSSRHETKLKKSERSSLKEKDGWWPGKPSKHSFCFLCYWMKMSGSKRDFKTSRNWQAGLAVDTGKVFIIQKHATSGVSAATLSPESLTSPLCHNKLIDKNCHWLCFIFPVLPRGCLCNPRKWRFASWPEINSLSKRARLMDHQAAAAALKTTSNTFSDTPLNWYDLQRGGYRCIHVAITCLSHKAN